VSICRWRGGQCARQILLLPRHEMKSEEQTGASAPSLDTDCTIRTADTSRDERAS
jgi:hypothetical protein